MAAPTPSKASKAPAAPAAQPPRADRAAAPSVEIEDLVLLPLERHFSKPAHHRLTTWPAASSSSSSRGRARGLNNMGNTCFLNATLQCLAHTPAVITLANLAHSSSSCSLARSGSFCALCALTAVINHMHASEGGAYTPRPLTNNLKALAKHFRVGRQEDAHEFLRVLLDRVHLACLALSGIDITRTTAQTPGPDRLYETSYIHKAFGGYLRNQLHCPQCGYDSNTFDSFLDLSLEIGARRGITSVEKALAVYTRPEALDKANKWKCPRCLVPVCAVKQLTIRKAPAILTVQLKRFSFMASFGAFGMGGKIQDHIAFPFTLDIAPALSDSAKAEGTPSVYDLYSLIVHHGGGAHSGHYFSFVQSRAGEWMCMDDSSAARVGAHVVQQQQAYVLFYRQREAARPAPAPTASMVPSSDIVSAMDALESVQWTGGVSASGGSARAPSSRVVIGTSSTAAIPDKLFNTSSPPAAAAVAAPVQLDVSTLKLHAMPKRWRILSDSSVCRPHLHVLLQEVRSKRQAVATASTSEDEAEELDEAPLVAAPRNPDDFPPIVAARASVPAEMLPSVHLLATAPAPTASTSESGVGKGPAAKVKRTAAPAPASVVAHDLPPPAPVRAQLPVAAPAPVKRATLPTTQPVAPTVAQVLYGDSWGSVGAWDVEGALPSAGSKRFREVAGFRHGAVDREWDNALDAGRTKKVKGPAPDQSSVSQAMQNVHDTKRRREEARKRSIGMLSLAAVEYDRMDDEVGQKDDAHNHEEGEE